MKIIILTLICFITLSLQSQITMIPDANFEQDLISQNIDSDGIVNGQVLTSDISGLTNLTLWNVGIQNLTGLEEFSSLEWLSIDHLDYWNTNNQELDLTQHQNLEALYF